MTMEESPLARLLATLERGETAAAEQVFLAYEPYLRMVVRRQLSGGLRAKFDSMDVVQSVWADMLAGFREARWTFKDVDHLRAFLITATRNRFVDRLRRNTSALEHEQAVPHEELSQRAAETTDRPSQIVQAEELWQQILAACPPGHREVVTLKRAGMSLDEITERTGFHKSSVRRILYDMERRITARCLGDSKRSGCRA